MFLYILCCKTFSVAGQKPFFGLFGAGTANGLNSLNDITENSIVYASESHNLNNMPYDYCMVITFINGEYGMQIAVSVDQNRMAYRGRVRGNWNPWVGL